MEYDLRDWLHTILLCHILVNRIQHPHNLVRCKSFVLSIPTNWWWGNTFICCIKHPIGAEGNVCSMKSHGAGNIESSIVYQLAKLRQTCPQLSCGTILADSTDL